MLGLGGLGWEGRCLPAFACDSLQASRKLRPLPCCLQSRARTASGWQWRWMARSTSHVS